MTGARDGNNNFAGGHHSLEVASSEEDNMENPLLNHLVVSKVLSFGEWTIDDLKKFRLVCSLWYNVLLDQWRQTVLLRISETNNWPQLPQGGVSVIELGKLITGGGEDGVGDGVYQLVRKPYSNYKMSGGLSSYPKNTGNYDLEKELWSLVIAPSVRRLTVENCYFHDSKHLEDKLFACRNLRELEITGNSTGICRGYHISREEVAGELPRLTGLKKLTVVGDMPLQWSKLLLHTPHLEALTIKQNESYGRTTFAAFLLDLHQLEYAGRNPLNIKHLDIMEVEETFTDLVSLSARNLRLESISLRFERIRPEHFLGPLLQGQARTLKTLELCRVSNRVEELFGQFEFSYAVHMPVLRELHLWGNIVKNLDFLRNLPLLKILKISRDRFEKRHLLKKDRKSEDEGQIPPDLILGLGREEIPPEMNGMVIKELEVLDVDCEFGVDSLKFMGRCMPNLKSIRTVLNNGTLPLVCNQWPGLQNLGAGYGSDVGDDSFCCIYSLKGLETVQYQAYCNRSTLTDKAFDNEGVFSLRKLKSLQVCVSEQVSTSTEQRLREGLPRSTDLELIRNYQGNESHQNWVCCQRLKFNEGQGHSV